MSNGFGFSFPNNDDHDDDRDSNAGGGGGFGPFIFGVPGGFGFGGPPGGPGSGPGGGLGDVLHQFGQMLSGMGSQMNSPEGSSPVKWDTVAKIAQQELGTSPSTVSQADQTAVSESVRLAELWLDDATTLPAVGVTATAWTPQQWLERTEPMWQRLITPVAAHRTSAQHQAMPEEMQSMMGPATAMLDNLAAMQESMRIGGQLAQLAKRVMSGAEFGLPLAPSGHVVLLPGVIHEVARAINQPAREVFVYVAAREAARQRLFHHVPWLAERIVSAVEEYAVGMVMDVSHIQDIGVDFAAGMEDPQALQEKLSELMGQDFSPKIYSTNESASIRLETLFALIEGWVDHVVLSALGERLPATAAIARAFAAARDSGGSADEVLRQVVGIEINPPKTAAAAQLWQRASVVGIAKRDASWDHPDLAPAPEHLDNPAAFIDTLLDDGPVDGFEEEFAQLEEMLRQEEHSAGSAASGDADGDSAAEGASDSTAESTDDGADEGTDNKTD